MYLPAIVRSDINIATDWINVSLIRILSGLSVAKPLSYASVVQGDITTFYEKLLEIQIQGLIWKLVAWVWKKWCEKEMQEKNTMKKRLV